MTSGAYADIAVAQDRVCATQRSLSGTSATALYGALFLPAARLSLSGSSAAQVTPHTAIIADKISLTGTANISLIQQ